MNTPSNPPYRQQGVALIVSLILLVAITLIGLAGMGDSTQQERMSGNMYDRSLAMQAAEAALRAAEQDLAGINGLDQAVDCVTGTPNCDILPADDDNAWRNASDNFLVNEDLSAGAPQYYIQYIMEGTKESPFGQQNTANEKQRGGSFAAPGSEGGSLVECYFRVTARSIDPASDGAANRAFVLLQTTVHRAPDSNGLCT